METVNHLTLPVMFSFGFCPFYTCNGWNKKCQTMEQYKRFDNLKALYNLILRSLLKKIDILLRALTCLDARQQITEMRFRNRNLASTLTRNKFTQSLGCTLCQLLSTIMWSVLAQGFLIIAWNFDVLDFIWFDSNHLMAFSVHFTN